MLSSKMELIDPITKESGIWALDNKEARIYKDELNQIDKKISFFLYILDFEILTDISEVYDSLWNKQYSNLMIDLLSTSHDITCL